jgi:hypothetical protein
MVPVAWVYVRVRLLLPEENMKQLQPWPKVSEWKQAWKEHTRNLRRQQRLARAPYYQLGLYFLLIAAAVALVVLTLIVTQHPVQSGVR